VYTLTVASLSASPGSGTYTGGADDVSGDRQ
jgi:hypothetical protein